MPIMLNDEEPTDERIEGLDRPLTGGARACPGERPGWGRRTPKNHWRRGAWVPLLTIFPVTLKILRRATIRSSVLAMERVTHITALPVPSLCGTGAHAAPVGGLS